MANVRLFTDDAIKLLLKLPDSSLDSAYLLYPDPWPKTRHHKRRFISATTHSPSWRGCSNRAATFRYATDIEDYAQLDPGARRASSRPSALRHPRARASGTSRGRARGVDAL